MKKLVLLFLFSIATAVSFNAKAGLIIYNIGETYNIVEKLPSECTIDGVHVNLAVIYDQFGLFWLPVWNYGTPKYILVADNEKDYWDSDQEILEQLKNEYNISFPDEPSPSLWNKIGLKPVIIIIIFIIIISCISSKKDEDNVIKINDENSQPPA